MTTHSEMARDQLAAAVAQGDALDELYASPSRVAPHLVGAAHDKLRRAIKLAEVHSLLAIADELARRRRPCLAEVGPIPKLDGHTCRCNQDEDHRLPHTCDCGSWFEPKAEERCIRTNGAWCPLHDTAHWQADRGAKS